VGDKKELGVWRSEVFIVLLVCVCVVFSYDYFVNLNKLKFLVHNIHFNEYKSPNVSLNQWEYKDKSAKHKYFL